MNLIEQIETGSFFGLDKLRFLSLAGNFLRELYGKKGNNEFWADLTNLEARISTIRSKKYRF